MSDTTTSKVSLSLANLEKIIERAFELPTFLTSRAQILEKKVAQFEEMIASYPDSASDLADAARAKVVIMFTRLYSKEANSSQVTTSKDSGNDSLTTQINHSSIDSLVAVLNSSKSGSKENPVSSEQVKQNSKSNEIPASTRLITPSMPRMYTSAFTSAFNDDQPNGRFDLEKSQLRSSFENSFSRIKAIESGSEVESIKNLLQMCARARGVLSRFPKDTRLQFEIFNMGFSKLSLMLREEFFSLYGSISNGINLQNLISFLEAEIVAQHSKKVSLVNNMLYIKSKKNMRQGPSFLGPMPPRFYYTSQVFCKYCKSHDHTRDSCPNAKNLLCFTCYQKGHTKRNCFYQRN